MKSYNVTFEKQDGSFYSEVIYAETKIHAQCEAVREVGAQWLGIDVIRQKDGFIGEIFANEIVDMKLYEKRT